MRDVLLLATVVGFFALAGLYVRWADRLVGPDDTSASPAPPAPTAPGAAASVERDRAEATR